MNVAHAYGMIQPGEATTKAVRAVFFIDPKGTIRTILYYPLSLGRNFEELYRVLIGLQDGRRVRCGYARRLAAG